MSEPDNHSLARDILERMQVKECKGVYVLGSFASRLTFSAQQLRAFNLIWSLFMLDKLAAGQKVAVVGGGVAGITAAAAAYRKDCHVTLIEQASELLSLQRGNFVRYVHPNILDWPYDGSEKHKTDWPVLNWEAGRLDNVINQFTEGWKEFDGKMEVNLDCQVQKLSASRIKPRINAVSLAPGAEDIRNRRFDCVIIAVGFGLEQRHAKLPFRSYWSNDNLHQDMPRGEGRKHYLVSGCGDGGLIDTLRLRLRSFNHEVFVRNILENEDLRYVKERLKKTEEEVGQLPPEQRDQFLRDEYSKLARDVPESFRGWLRRNLRNDVTVTLNGRGSSAVTLKSSILHRFVISVLLELEELDYQPGEVHPIAGEPDNYRVNFKQPNGIWKVGKFDEIVLRHGPKGVISQIIPEEAVKSLDGVWRSTSDPTREQPWDNSFFTEHTDGRIPPVHSELFAKIKRSEALALLGNKVAGLRVGLAGPHIGYIALMSQDIPEAERHDKVLGLPVIYERPKQRPRPKEVATPPQIVQIGSRIYNHTYNHMYRQPENIGPAKNRKSPQGAHGTLGCFVCTDSDDIGILSTSHGMMIDWGGTQGDEIYLANSVRWYEETENRCIATLSAYVKMTPSTAPHQVQGHKVLNIMDVSLAQLQPQVPFIADFPEQYFLPKLTGTSEARQGDRVFKVGSSSGLTYGRIVAVSSMIASVRWRGDENPFWMDNAFAIEGEGNVRFTREGDSGSVVVREESNGKATVLGMIFGSDGRWTYAFPIKPALDALRCELLLGPRAY